MNTKFYLPVLALAMAAMSCDNKKEVSTAGIEPANLDKTVSPSADFYQFACGGWMSMHPLTDEYSRFGSFDLLAENNRQQLKGLIEELAAAPSEKGTVARKVGDLYNLAMDSAKLNAEGYFPIESQLKKIAGLTGRQEFVKVVAEMTRQGYGPYFGIYVGADDMNSSMNLVQTYQGGLGLGDRDYYLGADEHNREIRSKYEEHMVRMFELAGWSNTRAREAAAAVMAIETQLATASYEKVKLRDPLANYHKMTIEELEKEIPGVDWKVYFETIGLPGIEELNVAQPEPIREVARIWNNSPLEAQKAYLQWKVIDAAAPYLGDEFVAEHFEFNGKVLSGVKEMKPRWKRAVATVDGAMGEAVGQMYVEKYFPAAAKERMMKLVENLQKALGERIKALDWMSEETKARALEKLAAIYVKVGYPDQWRDYSGLEVRNDSYWNNILRSNEFDFDYMLAKAGQPVEDRKSVV